MPLTPQQLDHYNEKGFVLVKGLVDAATAEKLMHEVEGLHEQMAAHEPEGVDVSWELEQPKDRPRRIRQLMGSELVSPTIDAISRSDELLSIMEQLIGQTIYLFHSKLMMKAAYDGTFTPWHQDWGYWQHGSKEPTQVNCMLAIDPQNAENGALRFVPGSHKQGAIDHQNTGAASFGIGLEGDINAYENELVEMQPGDAVFFGPLVIHGSEANTSPNHRRANTFAFDGPNNLLQGEYTQQQLRRTGVQA